MDRRLTLAPNQDVLKRLRVQVRGLAARLGADPRACDRLALVVDEMVNNAIEHGATYRRKGLHLSIELDKSNDRISIQFTDPEMPASWIRELARNLATSAGGMPTLDSERGRGLFLMSVYLEDVRAEEACGGGLLLSGMMPNN
jgi:anti-sigma regulatory factor (Ser/Thr protein kinase)